MKYNVTRKKKSYAFAHLRKLYVSKKYLGRKSQIAKNVYSPPQIANPQIATFAEGPQIYKKSSPQICRTYLRTAHLVAQIGIFTNKIFASHILNNFCPFCITCGQLNNLRTN